MCIAYLPTTDLSGWLYSEEIVREFYASYMQTLPSVLDKRSKPVKQDLLTEVLVRGCRVDILLLPFVASCMVGPLML